MKLSLRYSLYILEHDINHVFSKVDPVAISMIGRGIVLVGVDSFCCILEIDPLLISSGWWVNYGSSCQGRVEWPLIVGQGGRRRQCECWWAAMMHKVEWRGMFKGSVVVQGLKA